MKWTVVRKRGTLYQVDTDGHGWIAVHRVMNNPDLHMKRIREFDDEENAGVRVRNLNIYWKAQRMKAEAFVVPIDAISIFVL